MNPDRMAKRQINTRRALRGLLGGVDLAFDKRGQVPGEGHANLVVARHRVAEGVLYELTCETELEKLDRFERTPINYSRELVELSTAEGRQLAWVYLANPGARAEGLLPSRAYLDHLLAGAPLLSRPWHQRLARQPVLATTVDAG